MRAWWASSPRPARPSSWWWRTSTRPRASSPRTLPRRPSTAPVGPPIVVTWIESVADAVDEALAGMVAEAPRREEIESTLAAGGRIVLVRDATQAMEVVNWIAPEHLELVTAEPDALLPLVRNAGAVFLGPYAPTALGDYAAGANHVLPTGRSARFASALRVDDFRKHVHVVARPRGIGCAQPPGRRHRAGRRSGRARALPRSPSRPPSRPVSDKARIEPRDDLRARGIPLTPARRLGAAEHEREPVSPAAGIRGRVARRAAGRPAAPLSRSRRASACESIGDAFGQPPARVLRQRLQRGAADAAAHLRRAGSTRARLRTDVRAAQPHRPPHGHRGHRRSAARRLRGRSRCCSRTDRAAPARDRVPVQPEQPDGHRGAARDRRGGGGSRARPRHRRRGVRRVRTRLRARARGRRAPLVVTPARTRRCGRSRRSARLLRRAPGW